jgi:hypothetical protein
MYPLSASTRTGVPTAAGIAASVGSSSRWSEAL